MDDENILLSSAKTMTTPFSSTNSEKPFIEKLKNGYHPMTEGVRWTEKYATQLDKIWMKIPKLLGSIIATIAVFLLGSALQGIKLYIRILLY